MTRVENQERTPTYRGLIVPGLCAVILSLFFAYLLSSPSSLSPALALGDFRAIEPPSFFAETFPRPSGFTTWLEYHDQGSNDVTRGQANVGSRMVLARHFKPAVVLDVRGTRLRPEHRVLVQSGSSFRPEQFPPRHSKSCSASG